MPGVPFAQALGTSRIRTAPLTDVCKTVRTWRTSIVMRQMKYTRLNWPPKTRIASTTLRLDFGSVRAFRGAREHNRIRGRLITCTRTSPEAPGEPSRTFIDAAFALNVRSQRFIQIFVFSRVPQNPRPFGPGSIIHLFAICGAKDHGCEWFWGYDRRPMTSEPQRPASIVYRRAFEFPLLGERDK
jgi:hypothetical protein